MEALETVPISGICLILSQSKLHIPGSSGNCEMETETAATPRGPIVCPQQISAPEPQEPDKGCSLPGTLTQYRSAKKELYNTGILDLIPSSGSPKSHRAL